MSREHIRQPLIVVSPLFKTHLGEKKKSVPNAFKNNNKKQTVEEVIFAMRYRDKYFDNKNARHSEPVSPTNKKVDFENKLIDVLKKQNSATLTNNLVHVSFVGTQNTEFLPRNLSAVLTSREKKTPTARYTQKNIETEK